MVVHLHPQSSVGDKRSAN